MNGSTSHRIILMCILVTVFAAELSRRTGSDGITTANNACIV